MTVVIRGNTNPHVVGRVATRRDAYSANEYGGYYVPKMERLRITRGLSQKALAGLAGVKPWQLVWRGPNGMGWHGQPLCVRARVAEALGVKVGELDDGHRR